jgi:hypothetical protein
MYILSLIKRLFSKQPRIMTEKQLTRMSKDALEVYARTLGLELDKRHDKEELIKQILAEQKYYE